MIKYILSDFSQVILDAVQPDPTMGINKKYQLLKGSSNGYSFFDHFELNAEIIELYKELRKKYPMSIFTTGYIQNDPEIRKILDPIFEHIFSGADFNLDKRESESYIVVAKKLGYKPDEILYIDDLERNVNAAKESGMQAIQYTDVDSLKQELINRGIYDKG